VVTGKLCVVCAALSERVWRVEVAELRRLPPFVDASERRLVSGTRTVKRSSVTRRTWRALVLPRSSVSRSSTFRAQPPNPEGLEEIGETPKLNTRTLENLKYCMIWFCDHVFIGSV